MANIPFPQHDLPREQGGFLRPISGGLDIWDDGLVGQIITDEYFDEVVSSGNTIWIKVSGTWKQGTLWIKVAGTWKTANPLVNVTGVWN